MSIDVRHNFVSLIPDNDRSTLIQGPHWNEPHEIMQGPTALLGRADAAPGQAPTGEVQLDPATMAFVDGKLTSLAAFMGVMGFGAVGDGIADDTDALNDAFAAAAGSGYVLVVPPRTYLFTSLVIPANTTVNAAGATFRSTGTFNGGTTVPSIDVGANCIIDQLAYSTPGTEVDLCAVQLAAGVRIDRLEVVSDAQRGGTMVSVIGNDVEIGFLESLRIDNVLMVYSAAGQLSGFRLGGAYINCYRRAIFLSDTANYSIGPTHMEVLSPNGGKLPGNNGILLGGAPNGSIGDAYIADAGEHAFRIGGSPSAARPTRNVTIGIITAIRPGGCAFKINPTVLVSPGVTETANNISVVGIHGVDVGKLTVGEGNSEFLRISHARDCYIGWASVERDQYTYSAQYGLQINDTDGLWIGSLACNDAVAGMIHFLETQDVDGVNSFGGSVSNVHIGELIGSPGASNNLIGTTMTSFTLGNIHIGGLDVTELDTRLLSVGGAQVFSGPFHIAGRIGGAAPPVYDGVDDPFVTFDIRWGDNRAIGRPLLARNTSRLEIGGLPFSAANAPPTEMYLHAAYATAGLNAYGPGLSMSRVGSSRRGAAVAVKQTGSSAPNTGLAFFVGGAVTSTDILFEAGYFDHNYALVLGGALLTGVPAVKTASFAVGSLENDIIVNNAVGATVATLPVAATWPGRTLGLTSYTAFAVTSATANVVPRLGGAAAAAILPATAGAWAVLKSDGTNWCILRSGA